MIKRKTSLRWVSSWTLGLHKPIGCCTSTSVTEEAVTIVRHTLHICLQVTVYANQKKVQTRAAFAKRVGTLAYGAIEPACQRKGRQSVLTSIVLVYLHIGRCASVHPMSRPMWLMR